MALASHDAHPIASRIADVVVRPATAPERQIVVGLGGPAAVARIVSRALHRPRIARGDQVRHAPPARRSRRPRERRTATTAPPVDEPSPSARRELLLGSTIDGGAP